MNPNILYGMFSDVTFSFVLISSALSTEFSLIPAHALAQLVKKSACNAGAPRLIP